MSKKEVPKATVSTTSKKLDLDKVPSPHNFAGRDSGEASPYASPINDIKRAKHALASAHFAPNPECIQRIIYKRFPELNPKKVKEEFVAKKKTKAQKKIKKVMKEFMKSELDIGTSGKKVKSRKQAIAIALSEAGVSKKKKSKKKKKKKK